MIKRTVCGLLFLGLTLGPVVAEAQVIAGNASLPVTTTSASVKLPVSTSTYPAVLIMPAAGQSQEVFFALGGSSVVATTLSPSLPPGGVCYASVGANTYVAAITASSTSTLRITQMSQCPPQLGSNQSGGGGMTYPGAGVPVSTGSAWGTSITLGSGVSTALGSTLNGTGAITATDSPTFTTKETTPSLSLAGNISAPAWTTSGIRLVGVPATLTDTSSSGTVAAAYTDALGGNTIAASSATTYTDYYSMFIKSPVAGANATFTRSWSLGLQGNLQAAGAALGGATLGANALAVTGTAAFSGQYNFLAATLTDASSISWNLNTQQVASVTLGASRSMAAPTNMVNGGTYILEVIQGGTGSNTLTWASAYKWPNGMAPYLTYMVGAVDFITFISDGTYMYGVVQHNFQ